MMGDRYRLTGGPHTRDDGTVGQGDVFEPTEEELAKIGGKLDPVESSAPVQGADIGLRALPMTDAALELALEHALSEDDFEGVEPVRADGDYLKSQVEEMVG